MLSLLEISLYLSTAQLLIAKIHTSGDPRKGISASYYCSVFVLFWFSLVCLPLFLTYHGFQHLSVLFFQRFSIFLFTNLMFLCFPPLLPTSLCFEFLPPARNSPSSPSCLPLPLPTLRGRLLPETLSRCLKRTFRKCLLSTCRSFWEEPSTVRHLDLGVSMRRLPLKLKRSTGHSLCTQQNSFISENSIL